MRTVGSVLGVIVALGLAPALSAAQLALKVLDKDPPKDFGESIIKALQPKSIQVLEAGKPVYEFWMRKEIPIKAKPDSPSKSLDAIGEITLLGVAVVGEGRRDYKDNEITAGIYTVRFGLQPQDGDHLGTSEFPYFAVLIPAKSDSELEAIKTFKAMVKASNKGTASGHPVVLSLRPVQSEANDVPVLTEPVPDHKAIKIKTSANTTGSDQAVPISFELVVEGRFKS